MKPNLRPHTPHFSSGPCAKRPGWSLAALEDACLGRSHRGAPGKAMLREVIDRSRGLLGLPADYRIGIVPASDTARKARMRWGSKSRSINHPYIDLTIITLQNGEETADTGSHLRQEGVSP